MLTLRRVKLYAVVLPILALIALEIATYFVIGEVPVASRLVLDAIAVGGILIFAWVIFRFIGQMQQRLERQNEELLALHKAGLAVSAELSLSAVLSTVVDQARLLLSAKYGAISVIDRAGRIEEFITAGVSPDEEKAIGPPPVGHGVLGVVLHEGVHLRLTDVRAHPRSAGFPPSHPVMRTLLAVPISCKSPFLGNLYLSEKTNGGEFTEHDHETLERLALQAGIAIDNAYLHARAADLAIAEERLRISHEMHDGLAQVLGYVNTKVQAADAYLQRGKADEASVQMRELAVSARAAYVDVREGIVGLRTLPQGDRPLADSLREYIERWEEQSKVRTELTVDSELRLKPSAELQLVRIVQEALTNVRKHAHATVVRVTVVRRDGRVTATIEDDGAGFARGAARPTEFPRFGLTTMDERARSIGGTLEIDSELGRGTRVVLDAPAT
ncbi:MAG: GAF domain-containing protein [Thermoanaerobaculia bacterium]|nr:GAF domain-containing protein [Thermoanaerobaculia bacterium]